MTTVFQVTGYITETGELKVKLPETYPIGEVKVTIETVDETQNRLTAEEIQTFLTFKAVPADQLIVGGWENQDMPDSALWVERLRRNEENNRKWS
jgi:hypothetical protein